MIAVGEKAPLFTAESTQGILDLGGMLERGPVVLYFFPKANTPG